MDDAPDCAAAVAAQSARVTAGTISRSFVLCLVRMIPPRERLDPKRRLLYEVVSRLFLAEVRV